MAQLHFANLAPSEKKGTLLSVLDDNHVFTRNETMQAHIESGGLIENWPYVFSLVIIADKTKAELEYLLNDVRFDAVSGEFINKYKFKEPVYDSAEYWTMRNTGQIAMTFAEFEPYIELT